MTGLEVEHDTSYPVLSVKMTHQAYDPNATVTLVLSPPAAARLARELRKHLKAYLYEQDEDVDGSE